jgi:competence protein ComEC
MAVLFWSLLRNRGLLPWAHRWWCPLAAAIAGATLIAAAVAVQGLSAKDAVLDARPSARQATRFSAVLLEEPQRRKGPAEVGTGERLVQGEAPEQQEEGRERAAGNPAPGRTQQLDQLLAQARVTRYAASGRWRSSQASVLLVLPRNLLPPGVEPGTGDTVEGLGKLSASRPGDRHDYWLRPTAPMRIVPAAGDPNAAEVMRGGLLRAASSLPGDGPAMLPGMVMGDRSAQSEELAAAMKASGLVHLTAVSGANCAMLLGTVLWIARACRFGRFLALVSALCCLVGFVVLVTPEPSVIRAAVMGAVAATAVYAGRGKQAQSALCLCVVGVLAWDPWFAAEPAFQLSVLATAGIVVMGRPLAAMARRILPGWLADGAAISVSAQLFCLPVLVGLNAVFPLYAVPANIIAAPVVPLVTVAGTLALLLSGLPGALALPWVWLAGLPAGWIGAWGRFVAALPSAVVPWPEGPAGAWAAALLAALGFLAVWLHAGHRASRQPGTPRSPPPGVDRTWRMPGWHFRGGGNRAAVLAATAAITLLGGIIAPFTALFPAAETGWQVAACDVGQGDAILVRTGDDTAIAVDTGPDPSLMRRCLADLAITHLDTVFITHLHADHAGGVPGLVAQGAATSVYYSTGSRQTTVPGLPEGVVASRLSAGQSGIVGPVEWTVLAPDRDTAGVAENDASLVIRFTVAWPGSREFTLLETGDIEAEAMHEVLAANPELRVDVLKVSHHGARNGGGEVLARAGARAALISVGRDNTYGHPAPETLAGLQAAGTAVFRTDQAGTIRLRTTPEGTLVVTGTGPLQGR